MAPNERYHASDFSFKNAKLRANIITIDTLRAARVFIAFTFPQPSEKEVQSIIDARESFLPYIFSHRALLTKWRFNGVMNFRENDANRSNYVFSVFSNAFYALSKAMVAANRCFLFCFWRFRPNRDFITFFRPNRDFLFFFCKTLKFMGYHNFFIPRIGFYNVPLAVSLPCYANARI